VEFPEEAFLFILTEKTTNLVCRFRLVGAERILDSKFRTMCTTYRVSSVIMMDLSTVARLAATNDKTMTIVRLSKRDVTSTKATTYCN
jgi:uncharacterized protein YaeQ